MSPWVRKCKKCGKDYTDDFEEPGTFQLCSPCIEAHYPERKSNKTMHSTACYRGGHGCTCGLEEKLKNHCMTCGEGTLRDVVVIEAPLKRYYVEPLAEGRMCDTCRTITLSYNKPYEGKRDDSQDAQDRR